MTSMSKKPLLVLMLAILLAFVQWKWNIVPSRARLVMQTHESVRDPEGIHSSDHQRDNHDHATDPQDLDSQPFSCTPHQTLPFSDVYQRSRYAWERLTASQKEWNDAGTFGYYPTTNEHRQNWSESGLGASPKLVGLSRDEANELLFRGPEYIRIRIDRFDLPWGYEESYIKGESLGSGNYSTVHAGHHKKTNQAIAIKYLMSIENERIIMEIDLLNALRGTPHVVKLIDAFQFNGTNNVALVFDAMDNAASREEVTEAMTLPDLRRYTYAMLKVMEKASSLGMMHRDLKTRNLVINLARREIEVIDWGLGTRYRPGPGHSTEVASLRYRAPELILHFMHYDYSVDMWSVGAIFGGWMFQRKALFHGNGDENQLILMAEQMGSEGLHNLINHLYLYIPPETIVKIGNIAPQPWKALANTTNTQNMATDEAVDLLGGMLKWLPSERLTFTEALSHPFFAPCRAGSVTEC